VSPISYRMLPGADPKMHRPVITDARALFGWDPKVEFGQEIRLGIDRLQFLKIKYKTDRINFYSRRLEVLLLVDRDDYTEQRIL
jgi:hypothetical protein